MNDEKWHLNPKTAEDRSLIDSLLAARQVKAPQSAGEPCPWHEERESLIWAYVDDFLTGEGEESAWEEIRQCRFCLERLATVQRSLAEAEVWLAQQANTEQLAEVRQAYERTEWIKVLALGTSLRRLLPELEEVRSMIQTAMTSLAKTTDIILIAFDASLKMHKQLPARRTLGRAKPGEDKEKVINLRKEYCQVSLKSELKSGRFDLQLWVYELGTDKHPLKNVSVSLYDIYTTTELKTDRTTEEGRVTFPKVSSGNYLLVITQANSLATDVISVQLQQVNRD